MSCLFAGAVCAIVVIFTSVMLCEQYECIQEDIGIIDKMAQVEGALERPPTPRRCLALQRIMGQSFSIWWFLPTETPLQNVLAAAWKQQDELSTAGSDVNAMRSSESHHMEFPLRPLDSSDDDARDLM